MAGPENRRLCHYTCIDVALTVGLIIGFILTIVCGLTLLMPELTQRRHYDLVGVQSHSQRLDRGQIHRKTILENFEEAECFLDRLEATGEEVSCIQNKLGEWCAGTQEETPRGLRERRQAGGSERWRMNRRRRPGQGGSHERDEEGQGPHHEHDRHPRPPTRRPEEMPERGSHEVGTLPVPIFRGTGPARAGETPPAPQKPGEMPERGSHEVKTSPVPIFPEAKRARGARRSFPCMRMHVRFHERRGGHRRQGVAHENLTQAENFPGVSIICAI